MSFDQVHIDHETYAATNEIVLKVTRRLDEAESEWFRQMLEEAFDAGFDNCRDERDAQRKDPSHILTRRNPWRKPA